MKNIFYITLLLLGVFITSCGRQKIDLTGATYRILSPEKNVWTFYELLPNGQRRMEAVLEGKPTYDVRAAADMIQSSVLDWKGRTYAIGDDEIIFLGPNRTTTWVAEGIRNKLIAESKMLREESR